MSAISNPVTPRVCQGGGGFVLALLSITFLSSGVQASKSCPPFPPPRAAAVAFKQQQSEINGSELRIMPSSFLDAHGAAFSCR
jgi:hypothetical protein